MRRCVHPPPVRGQGTDPPEACPARIEPLPHQKDGPPLEALPLEKRTPDPLEPARFESWAE